MNYAILARIYIEWNEVEKSCQYGFQGLALSERLGQIETEVMCRQYLGHTLMFQADPAPAKQVYQRAQELAAKISPWVEQMTAGLMVDGLLDREPADQAAVQESLRVYDKTQTEYPLTLKARLLLKTGQHAAALEVLNNALAGMSAEVARLTIRPHVFRALALQALGDESAALAAMTQALTLSEPENRRLTFLREGREMEKLLRLAERKSICPNFTRHLLAAFARREKPIAEALIEPFSERELEVLRLLATDLDAPEIAEKLIVSANTVRTHIKNLYRKLNAHSRHEALTQARELKLI
jgi:LuxR family maltose regulon positive regulatory protein